MYIVYILRIVEAVYYSFEPYRSFDSEYFTQFFHNNTSTAIHDVYSYEYTYIYLLEFALLFIICSAYSVLAPSHL